MIRMTNKSAKIGKKIYTLTYIVTGFMMCYVFYELFTLMMKF